MAAGREKKLICGTEREIVVAHGRLPSPAPVISFSVKGKTDLFLRKLGSFVLGYSFKFRALCTVYPMY